MSLQPYNQAPYPLLDFTPFTDEEVYGKKECRNREYRRRYVKSIQKAISNDVKANWFDEKSGLPWRICQDPTIQRRDFEAEKLLEEQIVIDRRIRRQQKAEKQFFIDECGIYISLPMGRQYNIECNECQISKRRYQRGCKRHDPDIFRETFHRRDDPGIRDWHRFVARESSHSLRRNRESNDFEGYLRKNKSRFVDEFEAAAAFFDAEHKKMEEGDEEWEINIPITARGAWTNTRT